MNYEAMTSKELKAIAKEKKVKDWWLKNKAQLIADLKALESKIEEEVVEDTANIIPIRSNRRRRNVVTTEEEVVETPSEAPIPATENISEEPKQKAKATHKKPNLKLTELTYDGETKSIREWAKELETPWPTLYDRVNRNGWTVEEAIEIPLGGRRKK